MNTRIAAASLGCILLLAGADAASARLSCDDRPGTPITLDAKVTSNADHPRRQGNIGDLDPIQLPPHHEGRRGQ
jgi:hypothetical protein